ncbi:MAG: hypothetical protein M0T82_08050 [Desulfobacteraceae bacterium]|nr:hypothetical protein [Desulfobacteraceae bacterium]
MKKIRLSLALSVLILMLATVHADAKWWIFGQSNDEISINYLYLNKIAYDESGPQITVYKETLQDGLVYITGKASTRKGKLGGVRVTTNNKETWEEAKISENGAFEYSFRPEMGKDYILFIEIMDTAGKTNDIELTRKEMNLSEQNIMALIRETLDKMIEAYKNEDPARFMSHVSEDFTGDGANLDRAIRRDFNAFNNIDLRYTLNNVTSGAKGMVYVSINFNRSVISTKDGKPYTDKGMTEFIFQLGPARVYNMKNPLIFGLSDAENVAVGTVKSSSGELNISLSETNVVSLTADGTTGDSSVLSGTVSLRTINSFNNFQGFIFADEEVTSETDGANVMGDFSMAIETPTMVFIYVRGGVQVKKLAGTSINQITTADESGYGNWADTGQAGDSYMFKLSNNTYGVMEITNITGAGPRFGNIRYKYQPDGTRNF